MDVLHFIKSYHDEVRAALDALERADGTSNLRACFDDALRLTQVYLTLERDYLYPEISDLFPGVAQLVELGEAHATSILRHFKNLAALATQPSAAAEEDWVKRLAEVREAIFAHFESEEQILMPKMRSMIRTEEREDLGQVFLDAREEVSRLLDAQQGGEVAEESAAEAAQRRRA